VALGDAVASSHACTGGDEDEDSLLFGIIQWRGTWVVWAVLGWADGLMLVGCSGQVCQVIPFLLSFLFLFLLFFSVFKF
jgi:hypothetical protein